MAEHHYIIKFDDITQEWSHDSDSEEVRFPDGTIWEENTNEWFFPYIGEGEFYRKADEIDEQLPKVISLLNEKEGDEDGSD
jgi:hypothetical protein